MRIFSVPRSPVTTLGPKDVEAQPYQVEKGIQEVDFLLADNQKLETQKSRNGEIIVLTKSISRDLSPPVEVAKLKYRKRELAFDWGRNMQKVVETASDVLDAVLKIHYEGGEVQYVLLRDPGVRKRGGALSLVGYPGQGPMIRFWNASWAENDWLKSTKRQFLIRRWQVACRLRNQPDPFVVGSHAAAVPTASDDQPIIPDMSLKIDFDRSDRRKIQVRFEIAPPLGKKRKPLEGQIKEIASRHPDITLFGQDLAERAEALKDGLDARLKTLQGGGDGTERKSKIRQTEKDVDELRKSLKDARIYSSLDKLKRGADDPNLELRLIICLKLHDGTVLDVARFGDFATPKQ